MNENIKHLCNCDLIKGDQSGFEDWEDFYKFKREIENNPLFQQIYGEISIDGEKPVTDNDIQGWFQCQECKTKWCLHMPDPPFDGSWIKATWRK